MVLKSGADKVSVSNSAIKDPSLISAAAKRYGSQCVVLSMDVKRVDGKFHVFARAAGSIRGSTPSNGQKGEKTSVPGR